jgi:hypothetical protein
MSDVELKEVKSRISPTECTNVELRHASDIKIDLIRIVPEAINVLEVYTEMRAWMGIHRVTP